VDPPPWSEAVRDGCAQIATAELGTEPSMWALVTSRVGTKLGLVLAAEQGEDGEDPPVHIGGGFETELAEQLCAGGFYRAFADA
jgi:hypothetical protein